MNDYPIKAHYRAGTWRRYSINNPKNPSPNPCAVYLCRKWGKKLAAIKENDLKDRLLAAHHHRAVLWDTLSAINNVEVDEKSTRTNDGRPVLWWSLRPKPPPHLTIQKNTREVRHFYQPQVLELVLVLIELLKRQIAPVRTTWLLFYWVLLHDLPAVVTR